MTLPRKYKTKISERGSNLSEGQKQRISIARALYFNPDILILDESTSALDYKTEKKFTNFLLKLKMKKTIIIIAHRYSILKLCEKVYFFDLNKNFRKVEKIYKTNKLMKKILITGGTGFIGSHLAEMCAAKGYKVTVFDRYNPNYNLGSLSDSKYKNKINFIFGDIRDYDSVNNAVSNNDIVFHLAALIGISYISPNAYIKTNVEGTYNVLEFCRNNTISKVVITSTSEVYGSANYIPMDDKTSLAASITLFC